MTGVHIELSVHELEQSIFYILPLVGITVTVDGNATGIGYVTHTGILGSQGQRNLIDGIQVAVMIKMLLDDTDSLPDVGLLVKQLFFGKRRKPWDNLHA